MSNYKLYKQEGKLKEMPGEDYQYSRNFLALKEYDINPSDWSGYDEGQEVKEVDFFIHHVARPAKPSAKEKPANSNQPEEKRKSCDKSCSPSDYHKGGKCDINGCFEEEGDQDDELLNILVWYQSKSEQYRNETLLEQCVKDYHITKK